MTLIALLIVVLGATLFLGAGWQALRQRPKLKVEEHEDTVPYLRTGPADGEHIRIEGRVVVERPTHSPSGSTCALYELCAGEDTVPQVLRRHGVEFFVDDGVLSVRVDPEAVVVFDLPGLLIEDPDEGVYVERVLEPGARVQVVGRIRREGPPGHELLSLEADPELALTYLG